MNVVEADDGDIVGDAQAGAIDGVLDSDGGHIVGAHDGGGHGLESEELGHGGHASFEGVIALDDAGGIEWDATLFERLGECGEAGLGGVQPSRTGDEGDVAMAERGEVLHALTDAVMVVHLEQADAVAFGADVDEDERNVTLGELVEQWLFDSKGHDGDAIDLALQHAADTVRHAFGIVVGGADKYLVAVLDGDILEALDEFREEGIGDLGDDEAEDPTASRDEGSRLTIGEVVEFVDDVPDSLGDLRIDGSDPIDGSGDGGDGDIGETGDGADVQAFRLLHGSLSWSRHRVSPEGTRSGIRLQFFHTAAIMCRYFCTYRSAERVGFVGGNG